MRTLLLLCVLLLSVRAAHPQGCSMCRDTTAGSAPQIRAALRIAIPVLAVPAILIFAGFLLVARRSDGWARSADDPD